MFYEYYAHSEPGIDRDAWRLKELIPLAMWSGSAVDFTISRALDRIRDGQEAFNMAEAGRRHFRRGLDRSREIVAIMRDRARTKAERDAEPFHPLQSDYYRFDVGGEYVEMLERRVVECLHHFEECETFERIRRVDPSHWGTIAKVDEPIAPSFRLKGTRIFAAFDFWFKDGADLYVLDWKSGSDRDSAVDSARRQLAVYALWGAYSLRHPLDRIHTQAVWLQGSADWKPERVERDELKQIRDGMLAEIETEQALLDIRRFKNRTEYWANIEDFPARPSGKMCLNCKFRGICSEGRAACSHVRAVAQ